MVRCLKGVARGGSILVDDGVGCRWRTGEFFERREGQLCRFADWQTCAEVLNRTLDSVAHVDGERMRWIRGEYLVDGGLYVVVAALEEENQTR